MNEQVMTASYIAKHVHESMVSGFKGLSDDTVAAELDAIINLFRHLHGRDAFIKQAESLLAYRLLNKVSISSQHEELLLQLLKVECGAQQLNKMSQMMLDVELSTKINTDYRQHQSSAVSSNTIEDFSISVLTGGTWPNMDDKAARLPATMKSTMDRFTAWYVNKNPNRQLAWSFVNGSVEL